MAHRENRPGNDRRTRRADADRGNATGAPSGTGPRVAHAAKHRRGDPPSAPAPTTSRRAVRSDRRGG
jgi:hypothetical protein